MRERSFLDLVTGLMQFVVVRVIASRPLRCRIQPDWYHWTDDDIPVARRFEQRLGDITEEDAYKEGYNSVREFWKAWIDIYGEWDLYLIVWVYEFDLTK